MSIFKINSDLYNRILNEADDEEEKEEDFSIDDDQFNDSDEEGEDTADDSNDAQDKAVDDIMSGDSDEGDTDGEAEPTSDAQDQAADDIMSDDGGGDGEGDASDSGSDEGSNTGKGSEDGGGESGDEFDINMGDEDGGDDGESMDGDGAEGGEDGADGDSGDEGSSDGITDELIEKEKELFSDLSEKQLSIRTNELKGLYVKMVDMIESTSDRLSSAPNNKANGKIIKYLVNKLDGLQKMVSDYMVDTFETKTYIENTIYYHKCLMQLNLIKDILKEMASKTEKQGKQD